MAWALLNSQIHIIQGRIVYLLAAVLDIPIDNFEKQRFQLCHPGTPNQADNGVARPNVPPNNSSEREPIAHHDVGPTPKQKVLLISFAGATFLVKGFPRVEFRGILTQTSKQCAIDTTYLFLVDPSVTFYLQSSQTARLANKGKWNGSKELTEKTNDEN